jgi:hypothetical protein
LSAYDDVPDTTVPLPALSSLYSGPGPGVCGWPVCDEPAEWLVGGRERACTGHVGYAIGFVYAALNDLDRLTVVPVGVVS